MDFSNTSNFSIWVSGDLEEASVLIQSFLSTAENTYLWHCGEGIVLSVNQPKNCIEGFLRHGENLDDEWFMVFLFMQVSEKFSDAVIKVWDSDGDFLLVEAAEYLPRWANPLTTENRVFIHKGKIHLIPIASKLNEEIPLPEGTPAAMDAVKAVRNYPEITVASPEIQDAIQERIKGYPEKSNKNLHRCICYLPANAAGLLKSYPTMVAPSVIAFCHKDEDDSKACRAMRYFPPETRVMTSVLMTRHHYAMLTSTKYTPDRRTGWSIPPPTDPKWKANDLGLKIACGFEILLAHSQRPGDDSEGRDVSDSPKWDKYVKSLAEKGYFQGYMDGSKPYKSLLEKAKLFFEASVTEDSEEFQSSYKHHMGRQVQGLLKSIDVDYESLKSQERLLQPSDDDSWMEVTPDQLDAMMAERMKQRVPVNQDTSEELAAFMDRVSSYEGVELGTGKPPIPPARKKSSLRKTSLLAPPSRKVSSQSVGSTSSNISALTDKLGFDADGFSAAMQNILDFSVPEDEAYDTSDEDNSSGLSDYGSEPDIDFNLPTGEDEPSVKDLIESMERELVGSGVMEGREEVLTQVFRKKSNASEYSDDNDGFAPVSIDAAALSGLLESFRSQHGLPGPASSLLGPMGVPLEKFAANQE